MLGIMVFDFSNSWKRNLDDFPVGALNLNTGRGQCLGGFHAANFPPHAPAVSCNYFHVAFAIEGLKGCEGFTDFHRFGILLTGAEGMNPLERTKFTQKIKSDDNCTLKAWMSIKEF